jgi:ribose transport system permease protein
VAFFKATVIYPVATLVWVYALMAGVAVLTMPRAGAFVQSLFYGGALRAAAWFIQFLRNSWPPISG